MLLFIFLCINGIKVYENKPTLSGPVRVDFLLEIMLNDFFLQHPHNNRSVYGSRSIVRLKADGVTYMNGILLENQF